MRVGTWNCRQGLDRKTQWVDELNCDLLVVPECATNSELSQRLNVSAAWKGEVESKGLGIFAFNGWQVSTNTTRQDLPWCLPVNVSHPDVEQELLVLATWTVQRAGRASYAAQLTKLIDEWHQPLTEGDGIIAGDLNASFQGPSVRPHSQNVARLEKLGHRSAYHLANHLDHGEEREMTLRWIGSGKTPYYYHCDYIFVSERLADRVESSRVGSMSEWVESGRSDHCPVTADLAIS